jgi:hypothetical protein
MRRRSRCGRRSSNPLQHHPARVQAGGAQRPRPGAAQAGREAPHGSHRVQCQIGIMRPDPCGATVLPRASRPGLARTARLRRTPPHRARRRDGQRACVRRQAHARDPAVARGADRVRRLPGRQARAPVQRRRHAPGAADPAAHQRHVRLRRGPASAPSGCERGGRHRAAPCMTACRPPGCLPISASLKGLFSFSSFFGMKSLLRREGAAPCGPRAARTRC